MDNFFLLSWAVPGKDHLTGIRKSGTEDFFCANSLEFETFLTLSNWLELGFSWASLVVSAGGLLRLVGILACCWGKVQQLRS